MIGPDNAVNASFIPFASLKAFPHKISDERSTSAVIKLLFPLAPRPRISDGSSNINCKRAGIVGNCTSSISPKNTGE